MIILITGASMEIIDERVMAESYDKLAEESADKRRLITKNVSEELSP